MLSAMSNTADAEHIAAIARSKTAGFRFLHVRDGGSVVAIHAERWCSGVVDTYVVWSQNDAAAGRYRREDYGRPGTGPLWYRAGSVVDVVTDLVELPEHGAAGAPNHATRRHGDFWLPASAR